MTIEEKRRELFELWVIEEANRRAYAHLGCVLKSDLIGGYATTWVDMAWLGFNAALDAVVIELPPSMGMPDEDDCDGYEEYEAMEAITCTANGMRGSCKKAIESTGLGLKVRT